MTAIRDSEQQSFISIAFAMSAYPFYSSQSTDLDQIHNKSTICLQTSRSALLTWGLNP